MSMPFGRQLVFERTLNSLNERLPIKMAQGKKPIFFSMKMIVGSNLKLSAKVTSHRTSTN